MAPDNMLSRPLKRTRSLPGNNPPLTYSAIQGLLRRFFTASTVQDDAPHDF
jgi:hypothetical protein